jgi:hypothetical protein
MIIAAQKRMTIKNQSNKLISLCEKIQFYKGISNVWLHLLKGGKN